jgi:hypothetical protein
MQHHLRERRERLKAADLLEKLSIDGRIMITDLKIQDGRLWTEFIWLRMVTSGSSGEYRNETSDSL